MIVSILAWNGIVNGALISHGTKGNWLKGPARTTYFALPDRIINNFKPSHKRTKINGTSPILIR